MKKYFQVSRNVLLIFAPVLASTVVTASPTQAATVALANTQLFLSRFSQNPISGFTITDTKTTAISQGGIVTTNANANSFIQPNPTVGLTVSNSLGSGKNGAYSGQAISNSAIRGDFQIPDNTLFYFDFNASSLFFKSIDDAQREKADSSGNISFFLIDTATNQTLDYFNFEGSLGTGNNPDTIKYNTSANIFLTNTIPVNNYGGNQKFINSFVAGSVQRYFPNRTNVALVGVNQNIVSVDPSTPVPEPSITLGFFCSGVFGIILKRKRQKTAQ